MENKNYYMITEAAIPIPSRVIFTSNKVTNLGKKILMDILPETWDSHKTAVAKARDFVNKCHQTDYRSDSRIFKTKTYGNLLISFTQFYWYKGLSPEVTVISLNVNDSSVIEVYDFIVDSEVFAKEMSKKYHAKIKAKKFIPISSDNTNDQKKFPRLVELGTWAKKFFASLPNIPDISPGGMGNAMSFLASETDNKRLFDYQFFEWNQFLEAEHFAKQYFSQGYDVYKGSNSVGKNSIMIYVLKNQKPGPLPFFKKKYFSNRGMEKQGTST